ncbi:hypothetical protein ACHMWN_15975 [Pedobacter sp. UC225_61]|uniref:hypothetical protein n=1 Tax=Pedobacter sp. UC225_61 TaxID=3374623 RepID=UPI0037BAD625
MFTEKFLEELITCAKIVVDAPMEMKQGRSGFMKRSFTLKSLDDKYSFSGFINQNLTFSENFSIGLVYNPREEKGTIVLLRCNGAHGGTIHFPHHASCHIHTSTADRLNNGVKSEDRIEITKEYLTIEEAIQYYVKRININSSDKHKYFPPPSGQRDLFGDNLSNQ